MVKKEVTAKGRQERREFPKEARAEVMKKKKEEEEEGKEEEKEER